MKIQFKVRANTVIELEAGKQKDLFKMMASAQEVFGDKCCGLCKSEQIYPAWRTATKIDGRKVEVFDFPEMRCSGCGAKLTFGTINDDTGTLFPQRRLLPNGKPPGKADGDQAKYGDHNGWTRWRGEKAAEGDE